MIKSEVNEAVAATALVLNALLSTLFGRTGESGAQLRFQCGQLVTNGGGYLHAGGLTFWQALSNCFEAAPAAGATFAAMENVRAVAEAIIPIAPATIAVKNFSIRMALAEQARIIAATNYASREDVDRCYDQINASFDRAETVAADNLDNVAYSALLSIHAAVSNDLANRSRPLPRMTTYNFATRMPSLWMAQRLYYDPARGAELIAENKPIHPLFMPSTGAALSS